MSRITYDEALASLASMFPGMERGALEAVLESHGGAMVSSWVCARAHARAQLREHLAHCAFFSAHTRKIALAQEPTVEQLLVLAGDPSAMAEVEREAAAAAAAARVVAEDEARREAATVRHPSVGIGRQISAAPAPAPAHQWRHPLPHDFLRLPGVGLPPLPGQLGQENSERFSGFTRPRPRRCAV